MNAFHKNSLIVGVVVLVLVAVIGCKNPFQVGLGEKVDLDVPDVALTSHAAGEYLSGTVTLSGVYTDDFEISGITLSFDDGVTLVDATTDATALTWEYEVNTALYADGETEILITITDQSGKEIQKRVLYFFDNTAPLVLMTTPQGYATNKYNGLVSVRGEAADLFGIGSVEVQILDDTDGSILAVYELADGTNAWVYEFDSRFYADPAGDLRLEVRATDRAGNTSDVPTSRLVHYDDIIPLNGGAPISVDDLLRVLAGTTVADATINQTQIENALQDYIRVEIDNDLDKPSINIISPANGQLIGGSAIVTGTAFDDDGVALVEMRLDLNGDGVYDGGGSYFDLNGNFTEDRFEAEDWELLTGTVVWSETLNAAGDLYNTLTAPPGQVTIQVRATDINLAPPIVGNPVTIAIAFDDSIPRIENVSPASGGFVKGDFDLLGDIRDDEGINLVEVSYDGGVSYETLFDRDGGIHIVASITENAQDDFSLHHNIDTNTVLQGRAAAIDAEPVVFRIRISDNSNPPFQALTYVTLNVDNLTPTGTYIGQADPEGPDELDNSNPGVSGKATDEAGAVNGIGSVEVYFIRAGDFYNPRTGASTTVTALTKKFLDDGSTEPDDTLVEFDYPTDPNFMINIDNPDEQASVDLDGDGYYENISVDVGLIHDWSADPTSGTIAISDGPIDLHVVVYDTAGNGTHYLVDADSVAPGYQPAFIKNDRPTIDTLTLGTDLNFDGSVTDGVTPPGSLDETITYSGSKLVVRDLLFLDIDASDGGSIASYEVYLRDDTGWNAGTLLADTLLDGGGGTPPVSGSYDTGAEMDISLFDEATGPLDTVWLYARVTDDVGITYDLEFEILIDNDDEVDPAITLDALTTGSVVDGHVEASGESSYDNAPADADVSGTVALTGNVSDDQRIQTVYMTIIGFDADGAGGAYVADDEFILAAWDAADGRLEYSTLIGYPADSAVGGTLDPTTGHAAAFTYQWDSALITNSVATDVAISVRAEDFGLTTVDATDSTQVDVVPYISGVSTAGGIKDSNIRSMDGYYSIATSTTAATITINGYNLRPTAASVKVSSDTAGAGGISLGNVVVAGDYKSVTTDANSSGSGYLTVISDVGPSIPSINNTNSNLLSQNEEDDTFAKNLSLTDDRYIRFFNIFETGIVNGYYADMMMEDSAGDADTDPDVPTFGFVDDSAAFDLTLVREAITDESPFTTVRNNISRGLGWLQHGMGRDDGGSYFHVSTYNFSTGHQILFHDTYAKDYEFVASGVDGGFWAGTASPYWSGYSGDFVQNNNNDAIQMDWNQYAPGSLLNRYLVPKIQAKGDSLTGNAQVYLSFYDANEGALIFRNFQIGQTAAPNRRGMNDAGQSNLTERTSVAAGDPSRWAVTTSANNHFDMVITDNDEAVFIYFNQSAGKIELIYTSTAPGNTTPAAVTGADPQTTVNFSAVTQINKSFTGTYLSATIETDGNGVTPDPIHIAAHDSANGDLIYIKLDSLTDTTPEIVSVDQHLSVGLFTDIEVNDSGVPYITYYNLSESGTKDSVKLAWYKNDPSLAIDPGVDGSGNVTGDWEAMTIPVVDTPNGGIVQFQRVNLEFEDLDNATAGINLSPVVGYLADDLEYAKILPELP